MVLREVMENVQAACVKCSSMLRERYKNLVSNLSFIHVDESGYWFDYRLINTKEPQHIVIRHNEALEDDI